MKIIFTIILFSTIIYSQVSIVVNDFQVSENKGQFVYRPSISVNTDGKFAISWADERNGENGAGGTGRIYSTIFNANAAAATPNFWSDGAEVSNSYDKFSLYASSNLLLPNGNLVVAWHIDARASVLWGGIKSDDVYFSAFAGNAQRLIEANQLNKKGTQGSGYGYNPTLVFIPPSYFMSVFEYSLNSVSNIGCTVADASTGSTTDAVVLNDSETNGRIRPYAASNGTQTVITWTDGRSDNRGDIFMQRLNGFDKSGTNVKVNDNQSGYNMYSRAAMDAQGNSVIVWIDDRSNAWGDLYAQRYNSNGNPIGGNIKLTQSNSVFFEYPPAVALMKNGQFAVAWTDSLPGKNYTCKTRLFDFSTGEALTQIFELTSSTFPSGQVDLKSSENGNLYYTWLDGRDDNKGRIYGKVLTINTTGVNEKETSPEIFSLEQNYPNPFNPSTKISFSLPEKSFVSLKVFDILGKEVEELVNEEREAGNYEINFNAENLSNGVYVYKIKAGNFVQSKKMILVK